MFFDPPTIYSASIEMGHVLIVPSRAGWVSKFDDIGADDNTDMVLLQTFLVTNANKPAEANTCIAWWY